MSEKTNVVNYEIAYRLLVMMCAATTNRGHGVNMDMSQAHVILGVNTEDITCAYSCLIRDGIIYETADGDIVVG